MKKLLTLVAVLLAACSSLQAGSVRGYFRSNGTYVAPHYRSSYGSLGGSSSLGGLGSTSSSGFYYRNPYSAYPSVSVDGYTRGNGTYVLPHYRTPANDTITDNLNYRGYGTIRVPRY